MNITSRRTSFGVVAIVVLCFTSGTTLAQSTKASAADIERGRYLVKIAGCNDCHTANYAETAGAVPEKDWLTGVPVGFRGPWGTTYATNLRLVVAGLSEQQWMQAARKAMRPPMPWFVLRDMTDADVRAIYRYVRSLGPAGTAAPAYVPPAQKVTTPTIDWPGTPPVSN
ncbi:MAG TPA: cytochrome c [Casimicrobiaceae bacterium]|nr:cytochrome c [Casimicrobiaceae bacterium]